MDFLTNELYGNTVQAWVIAVGVAIVVFLSVRFAAVSLIRRVATTASRTRNHWDDIIAAAIGSTRSLPILFLAVYAGSGMLELAPRIENVLRSVTIIAMLVQGGLWISAGLSAWLKERGEDLSDEEPADVMTMNVIGVAVKIVLWSMVLLLALDNLGIDVTALVAGLGIGGVAVALAAQNILGDLFASLSIVLDKPFVLGDFLIIGDFLGAVESIGLKTTRVRSLSGEQVVFSNNDLLTSRIRNYGRMFERRVVFSLGVTYQTPRERLREVPDIIREAIESEGGERVRFDRAHMSSYGDFAVLFEAVYYVLTPEYNVHMDIKQAIFLQIHEEFEARDIEFAYPTQTLLIKQPSEAAVEA